MAYEFKFRKIVEFAETDMAGIVHFSNFFRFMEMAEHAFFRSLGFSIHPADSGLSIGWPRVHAQCEYKKPLRFEDLLEVHLLVREKKEKSLSYVFIMRKITAGEPEEVARGSLTAVCSVHDRRKGTMRAGPIPAEIARKIQVAPQKALEGPVNPQNL